MEPQLQKPKQQQIQQPLSDRHHQNRQQGGSSRRHNFKKNHHHHGHRKNPLSTAASDSPSSLSVNRLKTKIRDLNRLLRRPDHLPADVLVVQERALAGYKQALEGIEREKRKKEMIGKYHMVRFFERQKATRHLKQIRKRLAALPPDSSSDRLKLQEELNTATINLDYTIYYPLNEKYQSLYPPSSPPKAKSRTKAEEEVDEDGNQEEEEEEDDEKTKEGHDGTEIRSSKRNRAPQKPKLWDMIARCRETGQLETLRDGKLTLDAGEEKIGSNAFRVNGKGKGKGQVGRQVELEKMEMEVEKSGEESEGGFFEE